MTNQYSAALSLNLSHKYLKHVSVNLRAIRTSIKARVGTLLFMGEYINVLILQRQID